MKTLNSIKTIPSSDLPLKLREIPDPPKQLFVRGSGFEPSKYLAVIGSRKYSSYGKEACAKLILGLSGRNIVIVSGLALGIDSIAHHAALQAGLKTMAFPGSGLSEEVLYPRSNLRLAQKIVEKGGSLISEFEANFKATPYSFPQRNRLMAGIADAVLIIEASERSGSLITARLATDYNRDVFVVPGSIFSPNCRGSNNLLRQGATPITSSQDLLQELGFETSPNEKSVSVLTDLSDSERKVLEMMTDRSISKDQIIKELKISSTELSILLSEMEIKGLIKEELGKISLI